MAAWRRLLGLYDTEPIKKLPGMTEIIEQARREWLYAQEYYNMVTDPDLVDYAVFLIKAAERKYVYLLRKARVEGVTYPGGVSISAIIESGAVRRVL
ncbi:hypothetical protein SCACP_39390 [Sporomusa carbonis]|uniref:YaaL family protein n=1 Tax=Sporomusa carbonis TaxID=3076075 RepID=UPI003A776AB6